MRLKDVRHYEMADENLQPRVGGSIGGVEDGRGMRHFSIVLWS
jgi:hypothetical protein